MNRKSSNYLSNKYSIILHIIIIIFTMVIISSCSAADTIYVNKTGGNDSWTGNSSTHITGTDIGPKATIQNGTDTVESGGTVFVADGTYTEHIIIKQNLNLIGQSLANTIIDGTHNGRPLTINSGVNVNIYNFTITNGNVTGTLACGGGIYNPGALNLTNCLVTNNYVTATGSSVELHANGAGIYNNGTLNIEKCIIENNTAISSGKGPKVFAGGAGIYSELNCRLSVDNSNIQNNNATANGEDGDVRSLGAGICSGGSVFINESIIQNNNAQATSTKQNGFIVSADGGGIYLENDMMITGCVLQNNTARATAGNDVVVNGGGIYNKGNLIMVNSTIQNNMAAANVDGGVGVYGGGIFNYWNLYITNCTIQNNVVTANTPYINRIGGGGISSNGDVHINHSSIQNNHVISIGGINVFAVGGGIYNEGEFVIGNSTIQNNTVTATVQGQNVGGGGIYNMGDLIANFNRIVNNSPTSVDNSATPAINMKYNWWGSNEPEFDEIIEGDPVDYTPWLVMKFNANPATVFQGTTSTLIADFRYDSNGTFHDPVFGHLADGTPVTFTTNLGNVGSKSAIALTIGGVATVVLRADEAAGDALTSVYLDFQRMYATVIINPNSVNAVSTVNAKNVRMQNTGIPLAAMVLALVMVFGGFISTRK